MHRREEQEGGRGRLGFLYGVSPSSPPFIALVGAPRWALVGPTLGALGGLPFAPTLGAPLVGCYGPHQGSNLMGLSRPISASKPSLIWISSSLGFWPLSV